MKVSARIFCCLAAFAAAACNDVAFIEDFLPEVPDIVLDAENSSAVIEFEADNWDIAGVSNGISYINATIFDLEGRETGTDFRLEGLGKMVYDLDWYSFSIGRDAPDRLEITLTENLFDYPVYLELRVGNEFEAKTMKLTLGPTPKYEIESVEYRWEDFRWSGDVPEFQELVLKEVFTVDNSTGGEALEVTVRPYSDVWREIAFMDETGTTQSDFLHIFGDRPPLISIPEVSGGQPVPGGPEVEFSLEPQLLDCGLDPGHVETAVVGPGLVRDIHVYLEVETFSVPYTVTAKSPFSGKTRSFSGLLVSTLPRGCLVLPLEPSAP